MVKCGKVVCPVEIHVDGSAGDKFTVGVEEASISHDPDDGSQKNLLDLDYSDDENILGINAYNVFLEYDNQSSADNTPDEKLPYPDANSHSNYNLLTEDTQSIESWSKNIRESYSGVNSHENTFQDSNSHSKYDVYSFNSDFKYLETTPYDHCSKSSHSIVNSHETYRILTSDYSSDKTPGDPGDNENCDLNSSDHLIPCEDINSTYEIANSHSNYQIFYNSQTDNLKEKDDILKSNTSIQNYNVSTSPTKSDSSRSSISTEKTSTTCDIEECLVQIEESLLNIEQNLLHVQDLDIPELKNLLYKSPSIERSLFEVQDLLCTENLESVKRGQLFTTLNTEAENLLCDITSSKESLSPDYSDQDTTSKNVDENLLQFNDDKIAENPPNVSYSKDVNYSMFYGSVDKNVNFIPNSLNRTPTRGDFKGAGENIKAYSIDNADFTNDRITDKVKAADVINDNLNSEMKEKKLLDIKKCSHSRTNSLDENTMFQNTTANVDISGRKKSFDSFRLAEKKGKGRDINYMEKINSKAKSDDTLDNNDKEKSMKRSRKKLKENRLAEVEAKTDEFRRKIENIISSRKSIIPNLDIAGGQKNVCSETTRNSSTEEKSPVNNIKKNSIDFKDPNHSPNLTKQFKSANSFEKRKRKKNSRIQNPENGALVPSKLISLSLSLLLAALLQAVRCLTDLVEDAFRSVSYDRNGLLE